MAINPRKNNLSCVGGDCPIKYICGRNITRGAYSGILDFVPYDNENDVCVYFIWNGKQLTKHRRL